MLVLVMAIAGLVGCASGSASARLCDRVSEISSLPMKGTGSDEVYRGLVGLGEAAIPCLIEKIADTTPMQDPRGAPGYSGVVVGDIAFFVLLDITHLDLTDLLPDGVKARYGEQGVYAYFEYVDNLSNRRELQRRWRVWWASRSSATPADK